VDSDMWEVAGVDSGMWEVAGDVGLPHRVQQHTYNTLPAFFFLRSSTIRNEQ
jgi:hypothetical protein